MKIVLVLAWRSMVRHRRRSIITGAAISLGLAMMLVFAGLAEDGHVRMAELGIRLGAGHVTVQGAGYQEQQTLDVRIDDPAPVIAAAEALPHAEAVAPRVFTSGLVASGELSAAVVVVGVDPKREPAVSDISADGSRVDGEWIRARADMPYANEPADIYIGAKLRDSLDVEVDDRVILTVSPLGASRPASAAFRVRGVFQIGVDDLDGFFVQIPIEEAQRMLDIGDDVSQVVVSLDNLDATAGATRALRQALDDPAYEVLPWQKSLAELYEAIVLDDYSLYMMMAIVFVIVAIGIFNTVLMSVVERTREFGVMCAIGTANRRLFSIVMAEATMLGLIATAVGLAIGLSLHYWLATTGIDVTALYGEPIEFAGIAFGGRIYSRLSVAAIAFWSAVTVGLVLVSALYPAVRATRLKPVEAMRHV